MPDCRLDTGKSTPWLPTPQRTRRPQSRGSASRVVNKSLENYWHVGLCTRCTQWPSSFSSGGIPSTTPLSVLRQLVQSTINIPTRTPPNSKALAFLSPSQEIDATLDQTPPRLTFCTSNTKQIWEDLERESSKTAGPSWTGMGSKLPAVPQSDRLVLTLSYAASQPADLSLVPRPLEALREASSELEKSLRHHDR